jgi:hypothetical protein
MEIFFKKKLYQFHVFNTFYIEYWIKFSYMCKILSLINSWYLKKPFCYHYSKLFYTYECFHFIFHFENPIGCQKLK